MKPLSTALAAHLAGETTTLATCWKLRLRDMTVLGFTDHDQDITFESATYVAATGFTPSAVSTSADLAVDNLDVEGMLNSNAISEADLLAGKYDFAEIEIFKVNYADLTQGKLPLRRGWLGEVRFSGHQFTAEVRGLAQRLSQTMGELYTPACRAKLGDNQCKINLALFTFTASVTAVISNQVFSASGLVQVAGYFDFGKITFSSGANDGLSMEVKTYTPGEIMLVFPMPYTVGVGDSFSIHAGCDKDFATCINRFENAVNFRGEPHVPGIDKMLETAGTFKR